MPRSKRNYVTSIAGDRYGSTSSKAHTDESDAVRKLIAEVDVKAMDWNQLDQLERCASALLGVIRTEEYRRAGIKVRAWRNVRGAPGAERVDYGTGYRCFEQRPEHRTWMDHPYRLAIPATEHHPAYEKYVSEPYRLFDDGIKALAGLIDEGWEVDISAERALHYPGSTVQIQLTKKLKNAAVPG